MNWTLREKSEKEIQDEVDESRVYSHMVKGEGKTRLDICPLEVTKSNGEVKDVWGLTENEIGGLIEQVTREFEKGNKDNQRIAWAGQIIRCWSDAHPQISARMTAGLMKLRESAKTPVSRELVRDFMGPLANNNIEEARVIAQYLNGMSGTKQAPTDAQILQVLENMVNMQEMENSQNR